MRELLAARPAPSEIVRALIGRAPAPPETVSVRLTDAEYAELCRRAGEHGLEAGQFVNLALMERYR